MVSAHEIVGAKKAPRESHFLLMLPSPELRSHQVVVILGIGPRVNELNSDDRRFVYVAHCEQLSFAPESIFYLKPLTLRLKAQEKAGMIRRVMGLHHRIVRCL